MYRKGAIKMFAASRTNFRLCVHQIVFSQILDYFLSNHLSYHQMTYLDLSGTPADRIDYVSTYIFLFDLLFEEPLEVVKNEISFVGGLFIEDLTKTISTVGIETFVTARLINNDGGIKIRCLDCLNAIIKKKKMITPDLFNNIAARNDCKQF